MRSRGVVGRRIGLLSLLSLLSLASCGPRAVSIVAGEILTEQDGEKRHALVLELRGHGAAAVAGWVSLLENRKNDFQVHTLAAGELHKLGPRAEDAIPALVRFVRDGYPGMKQVETTIENRFRIKDLGRAQARAALVGIGSAALPALHDALLDPRGRARQEVVLALGGIRDKAAVPDAIARLLDKDKAVVAAAAWTLGEIGHVDQTVLDALVKAFADPEPIVRFESVKALGKFGGKAQPVRDAVQKMVGDPNSGVRRLATEALGHIPLAKKAPPTKDGEADKRK